MGNDFSLSFVCSVGGPVEAKVMLLSKQHS